MKAVLEFTYPQDENKLKHALKGEDYYLILTEIDRMLIHGRESDAYMVARIRTFLDEALSDGT